MKHRKFLIWVVAVILVHVTMLSHAQLQTLRSHYFTDQLDFQPAAAGVDGGLSLYFGHRSQWVGITGAPSTQVFSLGMSLPMYNSGTGLTVVNDMVGAERHTSVRLNYAYIIPAGRRYSLSLGLAAGAISSSVDGSKLITPEGGEGPLPAASQSFLRPDIAAGLFFSGNGIRAGFSYNNVLRKGKINGADGNLNVRYGSYLNLYSAYDLSIGRWFGIAPSVKVRTDLRNWQTDLGILSSFNDLFYSGVFLRGYNNVSLDAFYATVGIKPVGVFSIFYSYDLGLNSLDAVQSGSHEISIRLFVPDEKFFKGGKAIYNPRYL